ncbi:AIPR family protein [Deinococcus humi]|uniref:Abortive phage infection protein C-terminal domain-containing protein n=1 Tax=Deinococcus humi TaxID=662880 RepID=A0A7W8NJ32_9DEIO|nr:AIPR family protein [Deinococcus humi]MBB5366448.1 hypothetical protein [Deinococcus humi]GGO41956.1 hypothetical protein GCM10008949_53450 [Deinococcus humi]
MKPDLSYPNLLNYLHPYLAKGRTESAAFLGWYLEHYYRLDRDEAIDLICDQRGDKGVDGIFVNDTEGVIDILQSKISQKQISSIGDTQLKGFLGTISQFTSIDNVDKLIASAGAADIVNLIKRLDIRNKVGTYKIRGVFLSNIDLDQNGIDFLDITPQITFVGKQQLTDSYISTKRKENTDEPFLFDIDGIETAQYIVNQDVKTIIAPLRSRELVKLEGIIDQSLFALNVRGSLGKTQVNKDIVKSIKDSSIHKMFPLFHNGITIICGQFSIENEKLKISNYYVVNGCQSLSSLFNNEKDITDELRILTKIIQISPTSEVSEMITRNSNNQNGVKARDFKSNSPVQIRIQNEFKTNYKDEFAFEIKRGEHNDNLPTISNEDSGLQIMAFDLKEPWGTHRKYQVFDDKYSEIFAKPAINSDKIVFLHIIIGIIENKLAQIDNELIRKYTITKYVMLYIVRLVLESSEIGKDMISNPQQYVRDIQVRKKFQKCISQIVDDIMIDFNADINDLGSDFDYRNNMRDVKWVTETSKKIFTSYIKLVSRGRIDSLEQEWNE